MSSRHAIVLYGSETGNAQEAAEELGRLMRRLHFSVRTCAFDEVDLESIKACTVLVCSIATTGQGEFPMNSRKFWRKLLRKKLPEDCLSDTPFALFGLGDSSYPKYNWAAKKLRKRLIQLGAQELIVAGQGDEQNAEGHESAFAPFQDKLQNQVLGMFPLAAGLNPIPPNVLLEPEWLLSLPENKNKASESVKDNGAAAWTHRVEQDKTVCMLDMCLEQNKRLTPATHWQDVRLLAFSASQQVQYMPGDVLTVYPRNPMEDVDQIIRLMGWSGVADEDLVFVRNTNCDVSTSEPPAITQPADSGNLTFRRMLIEHVDLNAIPRRYFFSLVSHFTTDQFQRSRLLEFTDPLSLDELYDYTTRPRRSILEVLQEFDTVKIPWQWAAAVFPELRGRQFSIASGGKLKTGDDGMTRFELLVAIVKYKTILRKERRGVCTRFLEHLEVGSWIRVLLQTGSLNITQAEATKPILMVGPGTGVAPVRSLIWQRLEDSSGQPPTSNRMPMEKSNNVLFFGCRNRDADYFFEDEWGSLKTRLPLEVLPAFSRDQSQKQYVQDVIRSYSGLVYDLLYKKQGIVFVCGSSGKMPQAVREALIFAMEKEGPMDRPTAQAYMQSLEREDRYKQETW